MIDKKTFGTLLLILTTFVYVLRVPFVYLDFELRKEYISEYLCINKAEPITICGGTCYLSRQLKDVSSHEQSPKSTVKISLKEYHCVSDMNTVLRMDYHWVSHVSSHQNHYSYLANGATFRPPRYA